MVGPQQAVEGICIDAEDDMEMRRTEIADAIQRCDQGEGVIILTDLFGGTPSNLAISLMKSENVEVIAGVNLPMLIRLEGARKAMRRDSAVALPCSPPRDPSNQPISAPKASATIATMIRLASIGTSKTRNEI